MCAIALGQLSNAMHTFKYAEAWMTGKKVTGSSAPRHDRRSGTDRRKVDIPRKGLPERRRNLESRQPDVVEIDMSRSEWGALGEEPETPKR